MRRHPIALHFLGLEPARIDGYIDFNGYQCISLSNGVSILNRDDQKLAQETKPENLYWDIWNGRPVDITRIKPSRYFACFYQFILLSLFGVASVLTIFMMVIDSAIAGLMMRTNSNRRPKHAKTPSS